MSVPPSDDRRVVPRFKVWVACSILPRLNDQDFREQAVLGYVKDLSRHAIAVILPSNETYGVDPSSLGQQVQMTLALPVGYVRLSAILIRSSPDVPGKHLFVFGIEDSKERRKYDEFLDSLPAQ
jgi:PilZ domain-containing protein